MTDEQKKPYYNIMVDCWRVFMKDRSHETFSDEWWKEIIGEYDKLRGPIKGTAYDEFFCQLSQSFLDEHERLQKHERQNRISGKILSVTQGTNKGKIQHTDSDGEVERSKGSNESLKAEDWG